MTPADRTIVGQYCLANISENQIVTINRGDTFQAPLFINIGTRLEPSRYPLAKDDVVYVGIMEANQPFEDALVRKSYTLADANANGDIVVTLEPSDTECLLPGTYYYQAKLEHPTGDGKSVVNTIVPRRKLFLVE